MAEMSIDNFNVLCTKAEGRDKLARLFQYSARAFVGLASLAAPKAGSKLSSLEGHARTAMVQLAGARRTHRWCKELPVIQSIPKSLSIKDPVDRVLDLLQKVSLATFMIVDHVGHMKQWKILPGGKRAGAGTIQLGLKFFCFSNMVGALVQMKKFFALAASNDSMGKLEMACLKTAFKHMLLVLQTAHLSLLCPSHDALVGVAGMITSFMDVKAQWPAAKPVAAAVAAPPALEKKVATPAADEKDNAKSS
eukprot:CAMPEP_0176227220 /NCGR_PEP_ID=MMETSP0121_2-20121125/22657_1 /TAXON_ID=160619 /ORGANISM="Kryptoperidinium foliaceum, Strain CCMP 1326" /LENGTH=249 /DNA_ID=CAMNT_0017566497 /DNA_START=292 /DNA_END=1041 /DNA_ORIENTATION=-